MSEEFSTKVTRIGKSLWGCRVFRNGKLHSEKVVQSRSEVGPALKDLLRWVSKMGYESDMADASRCRNKRRT